MTQFSWSTHSVSAMYENPRGGGVGVGVGEGEQKVYEWPDFSGFLCERPHFSDTLVYAHMFRSDIFRGCLLSWYYMN